MRLAVALPGLVIFLAVMVASLMGCRRNVPPSKGAKEGTLVEAGSGEAVGVKSFDGTFGEHFEYVEPLSVRHDPYGGIGKVDFLWKGKAVGALHLHAQPPQESESFLPTFIAEEMQKDFPAAKVDWNERRNPAGCAIYEFLMEIETPMGPQVCCMLFHADPEGFKKGGRTQLRERFGASRIDFMIPKEEFGEFRPHLQRLFETFRPPVFRDGEKVGQGVKE